MVTMGYCRECPICRKARRWLSANKIRYTLRDLMMYNPPYDEVFKWHMKSGLPARKFFSVTSYYYIKMDLKNKLPQMDETAQLKLLGIYGALIKHPILIGDEFTLVGFKEKEWEEKLLAKK